MVTKTTLEETINNRWLPKVSIIDLIPLYGLAISLIHNIANESLISINPKQETILEMTRTTTRRGLTLAQFGALSVYNATIVFGLDHIINNYIK